MPDEKNIGIAALRLLNLWTFIRNTSSTIAL
jgi:hypothetical protein